MLLCFAMLPPHSFLINTKAQKGVNFNCNLDIKSFRNFTVSCFYYCHFLIFITMMFEISYYFLLVVVVNR